MKKLLVLVSALVLVSCNKFKVDGTTVGVKDGTKVFLVTSDSTGTPKPKDTVEVKNNKFEFEGKNELPEIAYLSFDGVQNGSIPFVIENGTVDIVFDTKTVQNTKIGGTDNNDLFQQFNNNGVEVQKKVKAVFEKNKEFMSKEPVTEEEKAKATLIMGELKKYQTEMDKKSEDFIAKNKTTFIALLLTENLFYNGKMKATKAKEVYEGLSDDLKKTTSAKSVKKYLDTQLPLENMNPEKKK